MLERRNPLPAGRYWVDAFGQDVIDRLDAWIVAHLASVAVVKSDYDPGTPGPFTNPVPHQWVLFDVKAPTPWEGPGYPTIAPPDVQAQADTVQRPPPWTWGGAASDAASDFFFGPNTSEGFALGLLVIAGLYLWKKL